MKRTLIIVLCTICCLFTCAKSKIEGLYVWTPKDYEWLDPQEGYEWIKLTDKLKQKESKRSKIVWDSLYIYSDNRYTLKSSRFFDVGGKIVKDTIYGKWYHKGEYIFLVPQNVNYRCIPNVAADSIITIQISKIDYSKDTIPAQRSTIYVFTDDGVSTYTTDNTGYANIKCTSHVWHVFIQSSYSAEIPFPLPGNLYHVVLPCYGLPNIMANIYNLRDDELWFGWIYKNSIHWSQHFQKIHIP